MDEELRKQMIDYFDVGDFAEFIGVTVEDLINAFPDEVEDCQDEILELMNVGKPVIMDEEDAE